MSKKQIAIRHSTYLTAYLLIVWGVYRFLFKLPEEVEELIIKPAIWLIPTFYFVRKEKEKLSSIGITDKNLFPAIYLALALGAFFALEGILINFLKYEGITFEAYIGQKTFLVSLGLSLATAISEEIAFRGYLFNRVWGILDDEWRANFITSFVWGLIHIPIAIFWWGLNLTGIVSYFGLTVVFGIGSAFLFARTKNITSSILLHVLWEWPIILFR